MLLLLACLPVVAGAVGLSVHRDRRRTGRALSAGALGGIDEFFHPAAHEARLIWEAEQVLPLPMPSPDRGPGIIEDGARVTIVV